MSEPCVIRFTAPDGEVFYWPRGFGYEAHEYACELAGAEVFPTRDGAARRLDGYLHPPAFWNSEREHAARVAEEMRGWKCEVVGLCFGGQQ